MISGLKFRINDCKYIELFRFIPNNSFAPGILASEKMMYAAFPVIILTLHQLILVL